jgi:hypothetical protein
MIVDWLLNFKIIVNNSFLNHNTRAIDHKDDLVFETLWKNEGNCWKLVQELLLYRFQLI